jgi:hypothetical protein
MLRITPNTVQLLDKQVSSKESFRMVFKAVVSVTSMDRALRSNDTSNCNCPLYHGSWVLYNCIDWRDTELNFPRLYHLYTAGTQPIFLPGPR